MLLRIATAPLMHRAADATYRDLAMTLEQRGELLSIALWPEPG